MNGLGTLDFGPFLIPWWAIVLTAMALIGALMAAVTLTKITTCRKRRTTPDQPATPHPPTHT